jgi:hypothetical protein
MGTILATPLLAVQIITWMSATFLTGARQLRLARNSSAPRENFPSLWKSKFFRSRYAFECPSDSEALNEVNL